MDALAEGFATPPAEYAPRTWFHVMSGNMSAVGITKDLQAMADIGLGGITLFHVTQGVPLGDTLFASEDHIDLIGHVAAECERLGLTFGLHNADGWTSSGGPWIDPAMSMKKLVWTETGADGGAVTLTLDQPTAALGYYEDVAVVAYPRLASEDADAAMDVTATFRGIDADAGLLFDGDEATAVSIEDGRDEPVILDLTFAEPAALRAVHATLPHGQRLETELSVRRPDGTYESLGVLPRRWPLKRVWAYDARVEAPASTDYRLTINGHGDLAELDLFTTDLMQNVLGRTGVARTSIGDFLPIGAPDADMVIEPGDVIDLTGSMAADGTLAASLPAGRWTIMRFGMTTTGAVNAPASPSGEGLETDKFSAAATDLHYDAFVGRVAEEMADGTPIAPPYVQIDSYEVGGQNWTHGLDRVFEDRYGYALGPYMPLFAGRFVGGPAVAETVLGDARRLFGELVAENYYGRFAERAAADGFETIIEPYGSGPFNDLDAAMKADVPQGEFWVGRDNSKLAAAVSAAHTFGKPIASAEAFTARPEVNWSYHPAFAKAEGDLMWARGINEFTFHRFAHQANTKVQPGMVMNKWGANFDRTQAWWDTAGAGYIEYLTRGQYLLRQGTPSRDVLLFVGENAPTSCPEKRDLADLVPGALSYDCAHPEVLAKAKVDNGTIVTAGGATYDILVIRRDSGFTTSTLEAIERLATQGAAIIGDEPVAPIGHDAGQDAISRFEDAAAAIWSSDRTYPLAAYAEAMAKHAVTPDLTMADAPGSEFLRRNTPEGDIYFLPNQTGAPIDHDVTVRTQGQHASLWDPMTGEITALQSVSADGVATTHAAIPADGAAFLVFTKNPMGDAPAPALTADLTVEGPWRVTFDKSYSRVRRTTLQTLSDLSAHEDEDVRHYSGKVGYRTNFELADLSKDARVELDLGSVAVAAKVRLNGVDVGTSWMPPHRLDVTDAVRPGRNRLDIEVSTLWINRLVGDAALPDVDGFESASYWLDFDEQMPGWYKRNEAPNLGERVTFTTYDFFAAGDPLAPSGLLGPVRIGLSE